MKYYIQDSRQYVGNCILWWSETGYTCDIKKAEVFNAEKKDNICNDRNTDIAWPKEYIDGKIQHHVDMQYCNKQEAILWQKEKHG